MKIYNPPFPPLEKGGVGGFEINFLNKLEAKWRKKGLEFLRVVETALG
jgi:hypothetical protein